MDISVTFVEYEAVNGLRDLSPTAFTLVSTAKLGGGNSRTWVLHGSLDEFRILRGDLSKAMEQFLRSSVASSVADVAKSIDGAIEASKSQPS